MREGLTMSMIMRRISAAVLAVSMLSAAVSCSEKNKEESSTSGAKVVDGDIPDDVSVNSSDLPYGATMVSFKSANDEKIKIDIELDKRYFYTPDEMIYPEAYVISDYVYALQTADAELLEKTFYKPFLDYSCEQGGYSDAKEYLTKNHESLEEKLGENFILDYIIVDKCRTAQPDTDNEDFLGVDETLKKCAGDDILSKVTSRKQVYLEIVFKNAESSSKLFSNTMGYEMPLFIYEIDGQYYVV